MDFPRVKSTLGASEMGKAKLIRSVEVYNVPITGLIDRSWLKIQLATAVISKKYSGLPT